MATKHKKFLFTIPVDETQYEIDKVFIRVQATLMLKAMAPQLIFSMKC